MVKSDGKKVCRAIIARKEDWDIIEHVIPTKGLD